MRDTTKLHPILQYVLPKFIAACAAQGIKITIGECLRTVAEQDALYAQGRTAPGNKVTNAQGSTYSSMHQWGVAFDFYLSMDVDGDGSIKDDAFNNSTGLFDRVGRVGKTFGLIWGGDWTSIKDRPHMQLANWGNTASKLRLKYGTPQKFMNTWYSKAIKPSSSKEYIYWLQTQLTKCVKGYTIKVTEVFDAPTRIAVLMYWEQLGWGREMVADGKTVGAATINALIAGRKE
jgi:hypothetical protein